MTNININLKRLGKKKVHSLPIILKNNCNTLQLLITKLVKNKVEEFNQKREDNKLISFLTPTAIQEQSETGKVGFGDINNRTKADLETSIANALQAFEDGLFVVFIDDNEITSLEQTITYTDNSDITFIRMTFLTGTYW